MLTRARDMSQTVLSVDRKRAFCWTYLNGRSPGPSLPVLCHFLAKSYFALSKYSLLPGTSPRLWCIGSCRALSLNSVSSGGQASPSACCCACFAASFQGGVMHVNNGIHCLPARIPLRHTYEDHVSYPYLCERHASARPEGVGFFL